MQPYSQRKCFAIFDPFAKSIFQSAASAVRDGMPPQQYIPMVE
jgi:hypothetical protein